MAIAAQVIHIKSRDAARVFASLTTPTDDGTTVLNFRTKRGRQSAQLPLLLDILKEEYSATIRYENVRLDSWLKLEGLRPSPRRRMSSIVDLDDTIIPIVRQPEVVLTIQILTAHIERPYGAVDQVQFREMAFSCETPTKGLNDVRRRREPRSTFGDDPETSGVWRVSDQRATVRPGSSRRKAG